MPGEEHHPRDSAPSKGSGAGLACGLGAYCMWGVVPLYFHVLAQVPARVVLCHRIIWSLLFLGAVVGIRGEWNRIRPILNRRSMALLTAGAFLIALNWLVFIYAVSTGQALEASLGYFINPLLSVALGMIFLHERLRRWQWLAVLLAGLAVVNLAARGQQFPWIATGLAASFGFYGLVRKKVDVNTLHGLLVETGILLPAALIVVALPGGHEPLFPVGLLSLSGVITAVPLLLFGAAVRHLRLSTLGFLQYVGPTIQLVVATLVFEERLDPVKLVSFALCWGAILIYIVDSVIAHQPQPISDRPE